jgi:hypothetical protein
MSESDVKPFIDLALSGDVLLDEIDNFIDEWHEGDAGGTLAEFLGMTPHEYSLWLDQPDMLPHIVRGRHLRVGVEEIVAAAINDNVPGAERVAARASDAVNVAKLTRWLTNEGLI